MMRAQCYPLSSQRLLLPNHFGMGQNLSRNKFIPASYSKYAILNEIRSLIKRYEEEVNENDECIIYLKNELIRMKQTLQEDKNIIKELKLQLPEREEQELLTRKKLQEAQKQTEDVKKYIVNQRKSKIGLELSLQELKTEVFIAEYSK